MGKEEGEGGRGLGRERDRESGEGEVLFDFEFFSCHKKSKIEISGKSKETFSAIFCIFSHTCRFCTKEHIIKKKIISCILLPSSHSLCPSCVQNGG